MFQASLQEIIQNKYIYCYRRVKVYEIDTQTQ